LNHYELVQLSYLYPVIGTLTACSEDRAPSTTQDTGKETLSTEQVGSQQKRSGENMHAKMPATFGSDDDDPGKEIYKKTCAQYHSQAVSRASYLS